MKAKITMVVEMEYEIIDEYYEAQDDSDEKRLAFDVESYRQDPYMLLDNDKSKVTFKGELLG